MLKELDPLLHNSQLRLGIVSILITVQEAEFGYLCAQTKASEGNLSIQLKKLKEAGYIDIIKGYKGNFPLTTCKISELGVQKFKDYINALKSYIDFKGD
ncbi:transcriptional regulator [Chryseobacterium sp. BIGb0232]|uniref:winged helix-turn-helix domain-containing protein n=1 Tax=Chryseobacterium sp. BIGb0232 TaxID=2940598 RepID=UPI000F4A20DD|nr:transcriptional regulator [Chryseobacterium sp. BIGb0232]MCS4301182.1 DNA-binding transcriptional ArsR family regulator [Chryseobacterium sp. BIGb0232]ROS19957.1 winged helix DNA-binding protein [Chryseobacterium nakagawai]